MKLSAAGLEFVTERHLATLSTLRPDGSLHVVPVGFTWDEEHGLARVIASGPSRKVRNAVHGGPIVLCQVDGRRWLSIEGRPIVRDDPASVAEAERRYARRYRSPRENPRRVSIEITVRRLMGSAELIAVESPT